jgi:hypothetical protein
MKGKHMPYRTVDTKLRLSSFSDLRSKSESHNLVLIKGTIKRIKDRLLNSRKVITLGLADIQQNWIWCYICGADKRVMRLLKKEEEIYVHGKVLSTPDPNPEIYSIGIMKYCLVKK